MHIQTYWNTLLSVVTLILNFKGVNQKSGSNIFPGLAHSACTCNFFLSEMLPRALNITLIFSYLVCNFSVDTGIHEVGVACMPSDHSKYI